MVYIKIVNIIIVNIYFIFIIGLIKFYFYLNNKLKYNLIKIIN